MDSNHKGIVSTTTPACMFSLCAVWTVGDLWSDHWQCTRNSIVTGEYYYFFLSILILQPKIVIFQRINEVTRRVQEQNVMPVVVASEFLSEISTHRRLQ